MTTSTTSAQALSSSLLLQDRATASTQQLAPAKPGRIALLSTRSRQLSGCISTANFRTGQRLLLNVRALQCLRMPTTILRGERAMIINPRASGNSGGLSADDGAAIYDDDNLFSHFNKMATRALQLARKEAQLLGHNYLGCENILVGLILVLRDYHSEAPELSIAAEALRSAYMHVDSESFLDFLLEAVRDHVIHLHSPPSSDKRRPRSSGNGSVMLFTFHYASLTLVSFRAVSMLRLSLQAARNLGQDHVGLEHLLLGLLHVEQLQPEGYVGLRFLGAVGVDVDHCSNHLQLKLHESTLPTPIIYIAGDHDQEELVHQDAEIDNNVLDDIPTLKAFCTDLTELAQQGRLDPVVGREAQITRVVQILGRKGKNNACLVGEPGVGKTAIAEAMAQMIVGGTAGHALAGKRVMSLDVGRLLAGTRYRGELEERVKTLMDEIRRCDRRIILFIDEIHTIIGAGGSALDTANLLKPALARGELQCIGATTLKEYRQHMEKDPALERRFQLLDVPAPSVEDTIRILKGLCPRYQEHHKVQYAEDALIAAAELSDRYITDRFLPDKAIDLIDEAGSYVHMQAASNSGSDSMKESTGQEEMRAARWYCDYVVIVSAAHIQRIVAAWTGIPVENVSDQETDKLLGMEAQLHRKIIGQDEAVKAVSRAVRRARVGLRDQSRPIASFIFCGPTGVGKSQLAKALASAYFDCEDAMVRLDMSEFMERHSVSKLIGSPPGYIGYNESGQLTEAVRRRPFTIVLLDEIEKAHPDVFNLLLQIMENGRLTDSKGKVVDFKNTLIIMTSNVGSSALLKGQSTIGFQIADHALDHDNTMKPGNQIVKYSRNHSIVEEELKKCFRPEFLNRLDEIVVFDPLTREDILMIEEVVVRLRNNMRIEEVVVRLRDNMRILIQVSNRLEEKIVQQGFCPSYGARPLRRAITRIIEDGVAEHMLAGHLKEGDSAILDVAASSLTTIDDDVELIVNIIQS